MADAVDISGMPDPSTVGLKPQAQVDPTDGMPTPEDLYTKHYGSAPARQDLLDEFMANPPAEPTYQPTLRKAVSQLTGLPRAIASYAAAVPAGVASVAGQLSGVGGAIVDPENAASYLEQGRDRGREWSAKVNNLANYVPATERGAQFASDLASLPGGVVREASDSTLGKVLPDNAYQAVGDVAQDVGTDLPALGAPAAVRGVAKGVKAAAKVAKNFADSEAASVNPPAPEAPLTPPVGSPVTGDTLRAAPNPIPSPEGTLHRTATEDGRSPAAPPVRAVEPTPAAEAQPTTQELTTQAPTNTSPTLPESDSAPQDMTMSPDQRALVREGVAARRSAEDAGTPSPGDTQRGSVRLFNSPAEEGPKETPQPEQQNERQAHLDAIDKLSGGQLPIRRSSALTGDYNATGDDFQMKEVGSPQMRQQIASENAAMHAATENVHDSVGSEFENSVDSQTLGDRGRVTRGAIQGIEGWFDKATDQLYDTAREQNQGKQIPQLARVRAYLNDDSNFTNDAEIGLQRAAKQRLDRLWTTGDPDKGTPPGSVNAAERFREFLNEKGRNPNAMGVAKDLKNHTDMDVAEHGGPGLFQAARAMRRHSAQMLEEPTGIKKLLTPADSQGINHAIPEHKVMDYIADLPREQHEHVLNVLRAGAHLGGGELAESSAAAIREIQAHAISRMHNAATNADGSWNARKFYNAADRYARNAPETFKDRPDILNNLKTINDAGNTLHMDKHYPGAAAQTERTGAVGHAIETGGNLAASFAHEIPVVGRFIGRRIENATERAGGKVAETARDREVAQRLVDRTGKQRGSVQLFNDNPLNRKNEERTTFHGKDINPRNQRNERTANQQMGGHRPLTDEQNDVIGRLMGGKQRGAVGDLSQRDAVQHEKDTRGDITHHRYSVPSNFDQGVEAGSFGPGGQMHVTEYPGTNVRQVSTSRVVPSNRGQGWGTRMLQRAADDAHAAGQVLRSDSQVSDGAAGAYKNLKTLGYDVKMKDNNHLGGAYHSVGDHVFEVRPPKGYEAPDELKNFIKKSAPAHAIDEKGPSNWEELQARRHEKVMPINPLGSEGSIYGDKATNIAFRAWHDKTHLDVNGGFDHDGELKTAQEQLRQAKAAGLSEESQKALWADTWETFKHHEDNGEFPKDPRQFVAQRMKDATPLGERIGGGKQRGSVKVTNEEKGAPDWWNQPSKNPFAKGMTESQVTHEFLTNSKVQQNADGTYRFYHGTPNKGLTSLRAGTQLELKPEAAARFASHDRGLNPKDMAVHNVDVKPWEIHSGHWATLRNDYPLKSAVGDLDSQIKPLDKQRGSVKVMNDEAPRTAEEGSQLNVGLHQGNEGDKNFRKMSKQEAQSAVESTGAKVTKNTVLTPKQHGVSEPTSVMDTDRPISENEMRDVLAKTKQSAIPQRTGQGDTSMHVAPGHEEIAKKEGWDKFNPDYFREHSGRTMSDTEASPDEAAPHPPRADATVKGAKQSKFPGIYDDPKEIMNRLGPGAPESPHLKDIFGVTRKDLHDSTIARGDVEPKTPIPGIAPKGKGSAHAQNVITPENAERIRSIIGAYKEHDPSGYHGMVGWYEMDPMFKSINKILGGDKERAGDVYHKLNSYTAYASPMSSVDPEIRRGTAAATMAAEGNFDKFAKQGGLPNDKAPSALKSKNFELGNEGHAMHSTAHAGAMSRFNETGQEANAVKTGTYRRSSDAPSRPGSEHQNTVPVGDSHWSRGAGLADVRGAKAFEGSAEGPEMKVLAPWYHDEVARHPDVNLPSTSAQAVQWGALSKETGVDSPIGAPKLEIWADQIAAAAKRADVSPKEMWQRIVKRLAK